MNLQTAIENLTAPGVRSGNQVYQQTKTAIEQVLVQHKLNPETTERLFQEIQSMYTKKYPEYFTSL